MQLDAQQAQRFERLFGQLMVFAADQLGIDERYIDRSSLSLSPEVREDVFDKMLQGSKIIDSFVAENPFQLAKADLGMVQDWIYGIVGEFTVIKHGEQGSILVSSNQAFQVLGVRQSLDEVLRETPIQIYTLLLPFDGCIVEARQVTAEDAYYDLETVADDAAEYPLAKTDDELIEASLRLGQLWDEQMEESISGFFDYLLGLGDNGGF